MNLPKTYTPKEYEPTIYGLWEAAHAFDPAGHGEPYSVVMPPPNANGSLHLGHALDMNLKDLMVRHARMKGKDAIYIPGADHAGFETWVVYEKELAKKGKSRFDFTRDELYKQVWSFVEEKRGGMELQLRALGVGAAWSHQVYTLDPKVIDVVYATFNKMWQEGLIYRGEKITSYCTLHQTGFADIEVSHKEVKSQLWHINYPLIDKVGEITVATTRPETMLGDTAIAVNPHDERYKDLIGKRAMVPIVKREIPIVADEAVDPSFGSGAVKVTPAHDPVDFEIGQRHTLPMIEVIGQDGKIRPEAHSAYTNMTVEEARARVVAQLKFEEYLVKEEEYSHSVGHCYKCGTVIQPLLMEQWFVSMKPLAEAAIKALKAGKIQFVPGGKQDEVVAYLQNLKDWNISRQIPWGIPIPAFQNVEDHTDWIFDERVSEPEIVVHGKTYRREDDTFDTWFSSSQWPYVVTDATSGGNLSRYFPTTVMETGVDLLRQWVSRMIMMSLYVTGEVPFKTVYFHGMVLDEKGQKMSKSKGNVIDPMEIVAEYGADATRMGIISSRSAALPQAFSRDKCVAARNFCNKLWNIARFIEGKEEELTERTPHPETHADHWVIRQLLQARDQIDAAIVDYRFAEAVETLYHVIWDDVADWYIEASKQHTGQGMRVWVLETCLKLAHPFAPFVSEAIWTTLKWDKQLLAKSAWPGDSDYHEIAAAEFDQIKALVSEARYVNKALEGKRTLLYEHDSLIADAAPLIASLAHLESVELTQQPHGIRLAVPNREAWIKVDEHTLENHKERLEIRLGEVREQINKLKSRLANERYVNSAPKELVQETRESLKEHEKFEEKLEQELEIL